MAEKILGIDLGTTNSCFAILEGGQAGVIANSEGGRTTPSVVSFLEDGGFVVGDAAKRRLAAHPDETVFSSKRLIGRRLDELESEIKELSYRVVSDKNRDACAVFVNSRNIAPEEISAYILSKIKQDASDYAGETIKKAVITVPAYFNDAQRTATKQAAEIAGIEVLRLINEPTAAALAYGFGQDREEKILVFDLGGGTFDVSVLDIGDGVFDVLATSGDNHLGGDDFDQLIVDHLVSGFNKEHGIDVYQDRSALRRIYEAAEKAKVELSNMNETKISIPFLSVKDNQPIHLEIDLTRQDLENLVAPLIERLPGPIEKAVTQSGLDFEDIDHVILAGGMTRMPAVQAEVEKMTGIKPQKNINQDEAVAIGAAIQAGVILGEVEDVLLLDVIPLSLGIETRGGIMTKLIEANSTVPVRVSEIFTTAEDNQPSVEIHIIQGERGMARDNRSLGRLQLLGIPPAHAGIPQIEVTFDVDPNSILSVRARDLGTLKETQIEIESATELSDSEIEQMKKDAEANQKADKESVFMKTVIVESEILVERAKEQLSVNKERMTDLEIEKISKYLENIEDILHRPDPNIDDISRSKQQLLEELQNFSQRIYEDSILEDVLSDTAIAKEN